MLFPDSRMSRLSVGLAEGRWLRLMGLAGLVCIFCSRGSSRSRRGAKLRCARFLGYGMSLWSSFLADATRRLCGFRLQADTGFRRHPVDGAHPLVMTRHAAVL